MLKIIKFVAICFVFLSILHTSKADIFFIDTLENERVLIQNGLYVFDNIIYYLEKSSGKQKFYCYDNDKLTELFNNELKALSSEQKFPFFYMADTNSIVFTFGYENYGNGIVVKEKNTWTKYDYTNSKLNDSSPVYDVIFNKDGEIAIINTSIRISFVKDGLYSYKDCGDDFDCMPYPFHVGVGHYFEGCLFYMNVRGNYVRMCNKEIDRIFSYEEFQIPSRNKSWASSYSIHKDKLYFCNFPTNQIFSLKGDEIGIYTPISTDILKKYEWDESRPLHLSNYIFGNDGFLYCLYKEFINETTAGKSKLFKLTEDFEFIENIPLPNQVDDDYNAVFNLVKDSKDTNNKKLYITASIGFYIYDPEPTSVKNNAETGPASLFLSEVYPNPSGGLLNIIYGSDLSNSGKVKMFLTNVMGQRIKEFDQIGSYNISTGYGTSILDVSDIANGNYQLVITDGNRYVAKNILIMR